MRSDHALRGAGRSSTHENHRCVMEALADVRRRHPSIATQQARKAEIALSDVDSLAVLAFFENRIGEPQVPGQIILDASGDDALECGARLN